jgi:hypothetical protein
MKKQIKILPITILLTLLLTACGSNEVNRITGDVESITQANNTNTGDTTNTNESDDTNEITTPQTKGFIFTHNGITIAIDTDFAPALAALGEPRSYFEAPSCAFEGLDKMYTFNGFEIDTYPHDDIDLVSAIVFKDDTVSTDEGLYIGKTRADMEATYGIGHQNDNGEIVYQKDNMKLCFILDSDNNIISIEYQTLVLVDG